PMREAERRPCSVAQQREAPLGEFWPPLSAGRVVRCARAPLEPRPLAAWLSAPEPWAGCPVLPLRHLESLKAGRQISAEELLANDRWWAGPRPQQALLWSLEQAARLGLALEQTAAGRRLLRSLVSQRAERKELAARLVGSEPTPPLRRRLLAARLLAGEASPGSSVFLLRRSESVSLSVVRWTSSAKPLARYWWGDGPRPQLGLLWSLTQAETLRLVVEQTVVGRLR